MIIIIANANERIGTGHIMRCLSVADAFGERNKEVQFFTFDHNADRMIGQRGYNTFCLERKWDEWDRENIDVLLKLYKPDLLIVDSYYVTEKFFEMLRGKVRTAYIDDLNLGSWDVDYLINYNISVDASAYSDFKIRQTKLLIGPQYAPLRKEFQEIGKHNIKEVDDIMVSAGGSDPEMITERILMDICPKWKDIRFHVVVGTMNPRIERIKAISGITGNAILHINEGHMAELMQYCDMAISAAGSTLYELCACGVPTVTYTLADNQLLLAKGFRDERLMLNAGDCRNNRVFIDNLITTVQLMIDGLEMRQDMSRKMQVLVDGIGANRLVEELLK